MDRSNAGLDRIPFFGEINQDLNDTASGIYGSINVNQIYQVPSTSYPTFEAYSFDNSADHKYENGQAHYSLFMFVN